MAELSIDPDYLRHLVVKVRSFMAKEETDIPDDGSNRRHRETMRESRRHADSPCSLTYLHRLSPKTADKAAGSGLDLPCRLPRTERAWPSLEDVAASRLHPWERQAEEALESQAGP